MAAIGLLYCAVVWGATFIIVKDALRDVDAVAMVAYRFSLAAACLLPWVWRKPRIWVHMRESAILAVILLALYVAQTLGLAYTAATNSAFISGMFVVFVPVFLLVFLRRSLVLTQWSAVALSVVGLWLLTGGMQGVNRGDALSLAAAMTYSGHLLYTDRCVRADADVVLLAFHQFWMTGAMAFAVCGILGLPLAVASPRGWWVMVFLAVLPTLSAFFIQMVIQKKLPPLTVSLGFSLEPVFAAVFAWTVGGEQFLARRALGGLVILAAMMLGEAHRFEFPRARQKEVLPL